MGNRLVLHDEFLKILPHVYFQPPSNITMKYPCIVYRKSGKDQRHASNNVYLSKQEYNVTVIEQDPDSTVADGIEQYFENCVVSQYYTVDNLNHTTLDLYY